MSFKFIIQLYPLLIFNRMKKQALKKKPPNPTVFVGLKKKKKKTQLYLYTSIYAGSMLLDALLQLLKENKINPFPFLFNVSMHWMRQREIGNMCQYKIKFLLQPNLSVYVCEVSSQRLEPWPLPPHTSQALILVERSPHQGCAVVKYQIISSR